MQENLASSVIALIIAIAVSGMSAVTGNGGSSTAGGDDEFGCAALSDYRNEVFATFATYPEFLEWWASTDSDAIEALPADEAEVIVDQGRQFVMDLGALDVPPVYEDGNTGVTNLYSWFNDLIAWVVLEEGDEPDTDVLADAISLTKSGEEAAAENCADEVEELDGFVLIDPVGLDEEDVPEDPGDVDKNFI